MAITYPLDLPASPGFRVASYRPQTVVGANFSPWTGEHQAYPHPGQWNVFEVTLPAMKETSAALWAAFFLSLNSWEGSFYMGPSIRKVSGGNPGGVWTVGPGAVANSKTLPVTGGTGLFAKGDWLQVGTLTSMRLHRVLQVNTSAGAMISVDVFPRLLSAYANGTAITHTNPKGVFKTPSIPEEGYDEAKICQGMSFLAVEAL